MRFTFAMAGWPRSVHDLRVLRDSIEKYGDKFPHPPKGKYYLVDSGYTNQLGYLAPYKQGPSTRGKKELFNSTYSSLRNVIERSFEVLKNQWKILKGIPAFPMQKQSQIILVCMALHNFVKQNNEEDEDFQSIAQDENYVPLEESWSCHGNGASTSEADEDGRMNMFRDWTADGLYNRSYIQWICNKEDF